MAKAPKKPKHSASLAAWENYDRKIKHFHQSKARKQALIRKHSK
jgi:hypothetical protein